jgi:hypothetical protein
VEINPESAVQAVERVLGTEMELGALWLVMEAARARMGRDAALIRTRGAEYRCRPGLVVRGI